MVAQRSKAAERSARYRARKKEKSAKSVLARDETVTNRDAVTPFHHMQLELDNSKRQNDRLQKMVDDLQHHMCAAMMANAGGGGVPMPVGPVNRMPSPPIAQPVPVAMPRAPSFGGSFLDVQTMMINQHHDSARKPGG